MNLIRFNYWFSLIQQPLWGLILKNVTKSLLIALLIFALVTFLWELWYYQLIYMPTMWMRATLEQQTQINILLCYMDLKVVFTTLGLLWVIKK